MRRSRIGIYVLIDALGAAALRSISFLPEWELRQGLRTVLGYSCACQPTLLTGLLPHQHGHGAMYQLRQGPSQLDRARPLRWLPTPIRENHRIRQRLENSIRRDVSGYFSLYDCPIHLLPEFDLVEPRSIYRPGAFDGVRSIFDDLAKSRVRYSVYDWTVGDDECIELAIRDLQERDTQFLFLYLTELDGLLHAHGNGADAVLAKMQRYESQLRELRSVADQQCELLEMYAFGDHGMSDVHGSVNLIAQVEALLGPNGSRYLAFYDSTMARFWIRDPEARAELYDALAGLTEGRWVHDDEREELGVAFQDHSQGDLCFVVNEGLIILPSYMGTTMLAGMHGYHPDAVGADAALLGLDSPSEDLHHIKDLYGLMKSTLARLIEST